MSLYQEMLRLANEEDEAEEFAEMSSFNHSYTQARLIVLLDKLGIYTPAPELSLDIKGIDLSKFDSEVIDEQIGINLPLDAIFD